MCHHKKFSYESRGFSLVEAIVALVVLSLVFTAVWGWFGTAATSTARIEKALAMPEVFSQFVVNLELENLNDISSGVYEVGEYQINWRTSADKKSSDEAYRRQPAWIVTLYKVEAEVTRRGKAVNVFTTKIVHQVPDPEYIGFSIDDR